MGSASPAAVKRLSDNAVFPVRCIKKPNQKDFALIWQIYDQEQWNTLEGIPHSEYSFAVSDKEKRGLQLFMEL